MCARVRLMPVQEMIVTVLVMGSDFVSVVIGMVPVWVVVTGDLKGGVGGTG